MNRLSILFYFLIGLSTFSSGQITQQEVLIEDNTIPKDSAYYSEANFAGTFQTIHRSKEIEIFTFNLYYEIEARRSETEVVLWNISPLTTIRIFPRNLIYPPMNYRIEETEIYEL